LPFATYSLAEHLESSGVLAVVILGMYLSWNSFSVFKTNSRIQMGHFWEVMIFILNGFVFLLLGMQLPKIISDIPHNQIPLLIFYGFLIFLILVMVRLFVLFISPIFTETNYIKSKRKFSQSGKEYLILSWAGMRGVVSLAAAFALPVKDGLDRPIEDRSTVLFLSFIVIILTLLIQGITLPRLIKLIKPVQNESQEESELNKLLLQKSISYLHQIPTDNNISNEVYKRMLSKLQNEEVQLLNKKDSISEKTRQLEWKKIYFRFELQLAEYQRKELAKSYHNGTFSLETIRKKEWELDFWVTTVQQEMEQLEQQFL
ncbi:MAG: cation:proton antiporter, partial [Empedobacter falsenii]